MKETRDRLIELLKQSGCVETWNNYTDDFKEPCPIETLADHLIANGVTVNEWRPASEPPKENGRYLVLHGNDKTNYQAVRYFTNNLKSIYKLNPSFIKCDRAGWYGRVGEMGICEDTSVTHWMPLPQPPKEVARK